MDSKETSDLSVSRKECSKCGAVWINGQHYWRSGARGDEETLSNIVCGIKDFEECINPKHITGHIYGDKDTWAKRAGVARLLEKEIQNAERTDD